MVLGAYIFVVVTIMVIKKVRNVLKMEFWGKLKTPNFLQNSILRTFLTFLIILMVSTTKIYAPSTLPGPEDSKKVSYVRLGWKKNHQDAQFPQKLHFEDFHGLPDHPNGAKKNLHQYLATNKTFKMPQKLTHYTFIWLNYWKNCRWCIFFRHPVQSGTNLTTELQKGSSKPPRRPPTHHPKQLI